MPRYKKKKHNRILNAPKNRLTPPKKSAYLSEEIKMTPSSSKKVEKKTEPKMKVVAGNKGQRGRRAKSLISVVAAVAVVFLILQIFLPAGVVQTFSNLTALVGTGGYPIGVSGSETLSVVPMNNYFYHLTDTHISAYSSAGKILFSDAHGFEKAVLSTSKGRALVYSQGGKQFMIYDLKGKKASLETKNEIICGAISDSGNYAIVTYSDSYASAVTVYSKRNKVLYEWYSAEETVNNVAIAASGKKIAVSTYNSSSGTLNSKFNIINFKSATPEFSKSYNDGLIYGLRTSNKFGFCVIKSDGIDTFKWSNFKYEQYNDDYRISYFRQNSSVNVSVFSRESDKTDNKIVILKKNGKLKQEVRYKGIINDIQVKGSNIYLISDTLITVLDFEGKVKHTADYGFGGEGIFVSSANVVAVVTDNEIKRVKINEKG